MLDEAHYYLSPAATAVFSDHVEGQMREPSFANARSVRNSLDRARLRHAHRLAAVAGAQWNRDDLMRLEPQDIVEGSAGTGAGSAASPATGSPER
jgi:hypothetical protein